jgi:hypothetical protein
LSNLKLFKVTQININAEIKAAAIEARSYSEAVAVALAGRDPARCLVAEKMMGQVVEAVRRLEDLADELR